MNVKATWKWVAIGYIVGSLFGFTQLLGLFGSGFNRVDRAV